MSGWVVVFNLGSGEETKNVQVAVEVDDADGPVGGDDASE